MTHWAPRVFDLLDTPLLMVERDSNVTIILHQKKKLFSFVFNTLNDILLNKLMLTLQRVCCGQSHI